MPKYNSKEKYLSAFQANYFQVFRVQDGWMALAKEEPFAFVNDPVSEAGELWFAFGDDPEAALAALEVELSQAGALGVCTTSEGSTPGNSLARRLELS